MGDESIYLPSTIRDRLQDLKRRQGMSALAPYSVRFSGAFFLADIIQADALKKGPENRPLAPGPAQKY